MLKLQFGYSFWKIDFQVGLDCQIIESICVREKLIFCEKLILVRRLCNHSQEVRGPTRMSTPVHRNVALVSLFSHVNLYYNLILLLRKLDKVAAGSFGGKC